MAEFAGETYQAASVHRDQGGHGVAHGLTPGFSIVAGSPAFSAAQPPRSTPKWVPENRLTHDRRMGSAAVSIVDNLYFFPSLTTTYTSGRMIRIKMRVAAIAKAHHPKVRW
jgi:hypothetical protein